MRAMKREIIIGFIILALGITFIAIKLEMISWKASLWNLLWISIWLPLYTKHICKVVIERYVERIRRETFPMTDDLNRDVDKIIDLKGAHIGRQRCK